MCRSSDKFPCGIVGKPGAQRPEPFVNQLAFANAEIQSHPRWYGDCTYWWALGSPGLPREAELTSSIGEPGVPFQMASKCVKDDRIIVRSQRFNRRVSDRSVSIRSVSNLAVLHCPVFDRATSACASSDFACSDSSFIVRACLLFAASFVAVRANREARHRFTQRCPVARRLAHRWPRR